MPEMPSPDHILCLKTERVVRNDSTVAYNSKLYQLKEKVKAAKVVIVEKFNWSFVILADNKTVAFEEITERPNKKFRPKRIHARKPVAPAANHPWGFRHAMKKKMIHQKVKKPTGA